MTNKKTKAKNRKSNNTKKKQLGISTSTANARLRKAIMFDMAKRLDEDACFQCGSAITDIATFSIEHKKPWLHESPDLFWDLGNIAFSHLSCNVGASRGRWGDGRVPKHGTETEYNHGCRCRPCKNARARYRAKWRKDKGKR